MASSPLVLRASPGYPRAACNTECCLPSDRMSAHGPKCRFAALQRYVRSRGQTGLVTDCLETSKMTLCGHRMCIAGHRLALRSDPDPRPRAPLFDQLVGAEQKRFRDSKPDGLGGIEIDRQLELSRILNR